MSQQINRIYLTDDSARRMHATIDDIKAWWVANPNYSGTAQIDDSVSIQVRVTQRATYKR